MGSSPEAGRVIDAALTRPSAAEFLDLDLELVRLLEDALDLTGTDDPRRPLLLARLASQLLGDRSADERREWLCAEAVNLVRRHRDAGQTAQVLDAVEHARWMPGRALARLSAADEMTGLARRSGRIEVELHGRMWRFMALLELGRVQDAEAELVAYQRLAQLSALPEALVTARARVVTIALLRGRFDEAEAMIEEVHADSRRIGLPDADRLAAALRFPLLLERDPPGLTDTLQALREVTIRLAGHLFEALTARILLALGRPEQAHAELRRALPSVPRVVGPRWAALGELAVVAAATGDRQACATLHRALAPASGQLLIAGGGVYCHGGVDHALARLDAALGDIESARQRLRTVIELYSSAGAIPWLAHAQNDLARLVEGDEQAQLQNAAARLARGAGMTILLADTKEADLATSGHVWSLHHEGPTWLLVAGAERAVLPDQLGLHQLARLVANPHQEMLAAELAGRPTGSSPSQGAPVLDERAKREYKKRIAALDAELERADERGEKTHADHVASEREALLSELRRAAGLAGRPRRLGDEDERFRINVTRTLWQAVERIEAAAPVAGAHLRASLRTGTRCRYEPAPSGPARWRADSST